MPQSLSKGIAIIFLANVLNLFFSLATNFLLPRYLPVESYAAIKTYQLYAGYIGLLHLGFIDGMYLFNGGKRIGDISRTEIKEELSTLFSFQLMITLIIILLSFCINNKILLFASMSILPVNMLTYFRYLYQSTGEYRLYGRIMNYLTIFTCVINLFFLLIIKETSFFPYIISYVILNYLLFIAISCYMSKKFHEKLIKIKFSYFYFKRDINAGYTLTLGNIAFSLLVCMGQWFVSFFLSVSDFAYYSFSVTIVNFINIAVTPISITLYNFFCLKEIDDNKISNLRNLIVIFSCFLMILAFCAQIIIKFFIPNYTDSIRTMFILFASQIFAIINTSVFVNLYKARKQQSKYMKKLLFTLLISIIINIIFTFIHNTKESYAIGTLLFTVIWCLFSCDDFKSLFIKKKEFIYITLCLFVFFYSGFALQPWYGLLLYLLVFTFLTYIFFNQLILHFLTQIKNKYDSSRNCII